MTVLAALSLSDFAAPGLIATIVAAVYGGIKILPERRRIVEDSNSVATKRATDALDAALNRYEEDNGRLRQDVTRLEESLEKCLEKLGQVTAERDELHRRVERLIERCEAAGVNTT